MLFAAGDFEVDPILIPNKLCVPMLFVGFFAYDYQRVCGVVDLGCEWTFPDLVESELRQGMNRFELKRAVEC